MIAAQGPCAYNKLSIILDSLDQEKLQTLKPFHTLKASISLGTDVELFIARLVIRVKMVLKLSYQKKMRSNFGKHLSMLDLLLVD